MKDRTTRFMKAFRIRSGSMKVFTAVLTAALLSPFVLPMLVSKASAVGNMTYTEVRLNRLAANGETTNGTVCAKPSSTTTETSVKVTFPSSSNFTLGATAGNWTVDTATTTGWPKDPADDTTSATAWAGIGTATLVSGQSVTFASGDLTAGTWYCFNFTGLQLTVVATAGASNLTGTVITQSSGPTVQDTGNYALATVGSSSNGDQIAVTATVNPSFAFSLSSNTAALSTLSTANPVSATDINAVISTNAQRGWNMWAADPGSPVGLRSATASKTIAYSPTVGSTAAALSNGVEGYNLGVKATNGGTCGTGATVDANFSQGGTSFKGGGLDGTMRLLGVSDGAANACSYPLTVSASISATTPAATDYAGTMTIVAAGRF